MNNNTVKKLPLAALSVHETSLACRSMIKSGISKVEVHNHIIAERGGSSLSLAYLEVRYGKMYGPRIKVKKI